MEVVSVQAISVPDASAEKRGNGHEDEDDVAEEGFGVARDQIRSVWVERVVRRASEFSSAPAGGFVVVLYGFQSFIKVSEEAEAIMELERGPLVLRILVLSSSLSSADGAAGESQTTFKTLLL